VTREPPGDVDAERSVLGALLLGHGVGIDAVITVNNLGLRPGDYYRPGHQHIAAAIVTVHERGDPVDTIVVADELRRAGLLDEIGGTTVLHELQNQTPTVTGVAKHARIVLEHARRRRIILAAADISQAAYDDDAAGLGSALAALAGTTAACDVSTLDESWLPIDLAAVLAGDLVRPNPTVLQRHDGGALFYAGMVNGVHGDSGIGKGWLLCHAIAEELRAGEPVLLIDLEDVAESVMTRLRDLGVSDALILENLIYLRPHTPFDDHAVRAVVRTVTDRHVTLAVVDSLGEAFGLEGIDENKDAEVGPWMRRVARALAEAGPAVVLADHATKAADNPLHPSGSKRKRAAIGGASYLVEAVIPLAKGRGGRLRLTCAKDRHGTYARGEHVADLVMTPDTRVTLYTPVDPGEPELAVVLAARAAVKAAKAEGRPMSQSALLGAMTIKARAAVLRGGIDLAVGRGALSETVGARKARVFEYVKDLTDD
jgi:DnaB-like helicase N terminal domain/AAA domain